jgi:hypothetical protein
MKQEKNSPVYGRDVMELVTVAVEYCAFLEGAEGKSRMEFVDTIVKILPLLYLKATLLPKYEMLDDDYYPEDFVTEDNYNIVRANISMLMEEKDDYLDVFMEDMKYSDTPISASVSENLADLYQEFFNLIHSIQDALTETQHEMLCQCKINFINYWGQTLCNVLRALNAIYYGI